MHAQAMRSGKPATGRHLARKGKAAREQVAAVCFRILTTGIEFLLVRTRRNRWTFPKGGVQPRLTHAQSAAIEAYEEAGVHGRIEEMPFVRYTLRKSARRDPTEEHNFIHAHLCEVLRLGRAHELNRDPTWFCAAKAKQRLAEGRTFENGAELARVIDRAIARIRRFPGRGTLGNDPLLRVEFEISKIASQGLIGHSFKMPPILRARGQSSHLALVPRRAKLLQVPAVDPPRR